VHPDAYDTVINHAAADAIRALLVHPHASPEAGRELRQVTTWLADTHGHDALRDLAETLAADIAELLGAFADANNRDPLDVLDEWNHDVPPPFTPPTGSGPT
jgi:hypothetical protein